MLFPEMTGVIFYLSKFEEMKILTLRNLFKKVLDKLRVY